MRASRSLLAPALAAVLALCASPAAAAEKQPRAECQTRISGSTATASCYNPNGYADEIQLHIECAVWWDPDVDGRPVALGPAQGTELSDRCWFGIRAAWVSHR